MLWLGFPRIRRILFPINTPYWVGLAGEWRCRRGLSSQIFLLDGVTCARNNKRASWERTQYSQLGYILCVDVKDSYIVVYQAQQQFLEKHIRTLWVINPKRGYMLFNLNHK